MAAQAAVALPDRRAQLPIDVEEVRGPSSTLFSYRRQLLDANGHALNGSAEMTFSMYYEATGGTPFWTEAHGGVQAVTVTDGLFHVVLGSLVPIDPASIEGDVDGRQRSDVQTWSLKRTTYSPSRQARAGASESRAISAGDYLVSSDVPGHAMVSPHPGFGVVIAQALEDLTGERRTVKAMIHKM